MKMINRKADLLRQDRPKEVALDVWYAALREPESLDNGSLCDDRTFATG